MMRKNRILIFTIILSTFSFTVHAQNRKEKAKDAVKINFTLGTTYLNIETALLNNSSYLSSFKQEVPLIGIKSETCFYETISRGSFGLGGHFYMGKRAFKTASPSSYFPAIFGVDVSFHQRINNRLEVLTFLQGGVDFGGIALDNKSLEDKIPRFVYNIHTGFNYFVSNIIGFSVTGGYGYQFLSAGMIFRLKYNRNGIINHLF